jgi:uncharacterized protein YecE (DUF72 family)
VIWVGTSGWQYPPWKGVFYPDKLPQREWLRYYATRFPIVEVNNSFYRLPEESSFDRWREESPAGFVFALKASRYITHIRRLREPKDPVTLFWSRAGRLQEKLGPILFQLPPRFRADAALLEDFLAVLPKAMRAAFEFRDDSWGQDQVLGALDRAGAAWVLADRPGPRVQPIVTGGWSYIRFHQGRAVHPGYTREKLRAWADRIVALQARDTYAFFNNDALGAAPEDAEALSGLLLDRNQPVASPNPP